MVTIESLNLTEFAETAKLCAAQELYKYLYKMRGGVKCSNDEQIKLVLGIYIIDVYLTQGLECLEDTVEDKDQTILHLLKTHITKTCRNCVYPAPQAEPNDQQKALPQGSAITTETGVYLVTQTGDYIITN